MQEPLRRSLITRFIDQVVRRADLQGLCGFVFGGELLAGDTFDVADDCFRFRGNLRFGLGFGLHGASLVWVFWIR